MSPSRECQIPINSKAIFLDELLNLAEKNSIQQGLGNIRQPSRIKTNIISQVKQHNLYDN